MSIQKPQPLLSLAAERTRCPVCQQTTYSAGGIHPQCALKRASAAIDLKRDLTAAPAKPKPTARNHWLRACPKCAREVSIRRGVCDCGHSFLTNKIRAANGPR